MSDDVSDALFTVEELDLAILFPFALLAFPKIKGNNFRNMLDRKSVV